MSKTAKSRTPFVDKDEIVLGVLTAVYRNSNTSQRHISSEIGVALGLANVYLRRCVRKGLVKMKQAPARRYAYYLTPSGFAEKTRLTGQYLSTSFDFFRLARDQLSSLILSCVAKNWRRIALVGISDLAEIAILCARNHDVEFVAVIDADHAEEEFYGLPVRAALSECAALDAVIITHFVPSEELYDQLAAELGGDRVLAASLLSIGQNIEDTAQGRRNKR